MIYWTNLPLLLVLVQPSIFFVFVSTRLLLYFSLFHLSDCHYFFKFCRTLLPLTQWHQHIFKHWRADGRWWLWCERGAMVGVVGLYLAGIMCWLLLFLRCVCGRWLCLILCLVTTCWEKTRFRRRQHCDLNLCLLLGDTDSLDGKWLNGCFKDFLK